MPVRRTRAATTPNSSMGSAGLARWLWNPARSARVRSSVRAKGGQRHGWNPTTIGSTATAYLSDERVTIFHGQPDVANDDVRAILDEDSINSSWSQANSFSVWRFASRIVPFSSTMTIASGAALSTDSAWIMKLATRRATPEIVYDCSWWALLCRP